MFCEWYMCKAPTILLPRGGLGFLCLTEFFFQVSWKSKNFFHTPSKTKFFFITYMSKKFFFLPKKVQMHCLSRYFISTKKCLALSVTRLWTRYRLIAFVDHFQHCDILLIHHTSITQSYHGQTYIILHYKATDLWRGSSLYK